MEKTKILVVDDESLTCELIKNFLLRKDYEVYTAYTKESAENLVREIKPNLVLLDIRLEEKSGLEVLKEIKDFDSKIKVIIVTGVEDKENILEARCLGADGYITKPIELEYLHQVILENISF